MKILPISNYQMQNQNNKQDIGFGVNLSNRAINRIQQCIAHGEGFDINSVKSLQKLNDAMIEGIDFFDKGGFLLKWKDKGLASTIEITRENEYIDVKFLKALLKDSDALRMSSYLKKLARLYFPMQIAEMRLKFPTINGRNYAKKLAELESLKQGKKPLAEEVFKTEWDYIPTVESGVSRRAWDNSNDLV